MYNESAFLSASETIISAINNAPSVFETITKEFYQIKGAKILERFEKYMEKEPKDVFLPNPSKGFLSAFHKIFPEIKSTLVKHLDPKKEQSQNTKMEK